ncbi:hypothetical protein [Comamonas jiangduensis]|uniref:hypothetical protein n=1 Tax=Comamonas jiangduensis TaxID=1194168 RepID=UPI0024E0ADEB|nr:hypothetical protein [Comamonas jiangduensis]
MFQLVEPTEVNITNANPRRELHGEEKVRAIDLAFTLTGDNKLLDLIQDGLRVHHYCNRAADAQQESLLPQELAHLPNIRHPNLPTVYHYQKGVKLRGYRFIWDYGLDDARVDFQDVVLANLQYEIFEGGSVEVKGTIQYNGEELQDNILYGELSGLASEEPIYIKLLAPATAQVAKKGYRAGKPDTQASPEKNPDQLDLEDGQQSPEDAFALAAMGKVWSRGCDEEKYDCIDALLAATHSEEALEVGEELDIETESGLLVVIRITAVDEDTDKASFEVVSQQALEEAEG